VGPVRSAPLPIEADVATDKVVELYAWAKAIGLEGQLPSVVIVSSRNECDMVVAE